MSQKRKNPALTCIHCSLFISTPLARREVMALSMIFSTIWVLPLASSSLAAVIQMWRSVGMFSRALFRTRRAFSYVSRRASASHSWTTGRFAGLDANCSECGEDRKRDENGNVPRRWWGNTPRLCWAWSWRPLVLPAQQPSSTIGLTWTRSPGLHRLAEWRLHVVVIKN